MPVELQVYGIVSVSFICRVFPLQLGYTFDEKQIARDFWYFLRQFYAKHPKYAKLDLYVIGESYGEQRVARLDLVTVGA